MSERYQCVLSLPGSLYAFGAPVMIGAGSLVEDSSTGWRLARLELINIQQKKITAVKVKLTPLDSQGSPCGEVVTHPYMDLCLERNQCVGGDMNILLPGSDADSFSVQVTEVFFDDKSSWISDGTPWEVLPEPVELAELYTPEIVHQIRMEEGEDYRFLPQERKDLWRCVCGSWNRKEEKCCHSCRRDLS